MEEFKEGIEEDAQILHAPLLMFDEEQPVLEIFSGEWGRVRVREEVIERESVRGRDCRAAVIQIKQIAISISIFPTSKKDGTDWRERTHAVRSEEGSTAVCAPTADHDLARVGSAVRALVPVLLLLLLLGSDARVVCVGAEGATCDSGPTKLPAASYRRVR